MESCSGVDAAGGHQVGLGEESATGARKICAGDGHGTAGEGLKATQLDGHVDDESPGRIVR